MPNETPPSPTESDLKIQSAEEGVEIGKGERVIITVNAPTEVGILVFGMVETFFNQVADPKYTMFEDKFGEHYEAADDNMPNFGQKTRLQ